MKKLNILQKFILMFSTIFFIVGCTSDIDNDTSGLTISPKSKEVHSYGYVSAKLLDQFIIMGENEFFSRLNRLEDEINLNYDSGELISPEVYSLLVSIIFQIDFDLINDYINLTILNSETIASNALFENTFQQGIVDYVEDSSKQKLIFSFLADVFDAGCGGQILAGFLDTTISIVGLVVTAPTGVGLVLGGAGAISSFGSLMNTMVDCYEP